MTRRRSFDSGKLDQIIVAVSDNLVTAAIHFRLYQDLRGAVAEYEREMNQALAFWSLSLAAHADGALHRLARAFDPRKDVASLPHLLKWIGTHGHLFSTAAFRARRAANPHVDSLAATPRDPDTQALARDLARVRTDPAVKRLVALRNNVLAHTSLERALNPSARGTRFPLSDDDVQALLDLGRDLINRYRGLFSATIVSTRIVGHDDYLSVLRALKRDLNAQEQEHMT